MWLLLFFILVSLCFVATTGVCFVCLCAEQAEVLTEG